MVCSSMDDVSAPSQFYVSFIISALLIQRYSPVKLIVTTFTLILLPNILFQHLFQLAQIKKVKNHLTSNFS